MIFVSMLLHIFVVFIYCYYYLHVRHRLYIIHRGGYDSVYVIHYEAGIDVVVFL
ncbi:hypothetical protein [Ehrlichia ruminantium]|uniref:hypothetical protein n=1 Tax=Ehrlichia ruminantium TaxID=779 RepID=UPI0002EEA34D|nr:hypothetical protein [Ehrlichia ruminantium]UOD99532.1 hypothetical protein IMW62_04080 [Ehrlichia ruminantium]